MIATALRYGLYSALIIAVISIPVWMISEGQDTMQYGILIGYSTMAIALSMVYLAIRSHRTSLPNQRINISTALGVGAIVAVCATLAWAVSWEVSMAGKMDTFMQEYGAQQIAELQAEGASASVIAEQNATNAEWAELYKNPMIRLVMSAGEILPFGLLVTLIAGLIESRRKAL